MKDIANKESAPEVLIFGDINNDTTILDLEEEDALEDLFDEDYDGDQERNSKVITRWRKSSSMTLWSMKTMLQIP